MKDRRIDWPTFNAVVHCWSSAEHQCQLYFECAYGWPNRQKRTASNCKLWRRLQTTEPPLRHDPDKCEDCVRKKNRSGLASILATMQTCPIGPPDKTASCVKHQRLSSDGKA